VSFEVLWFILIAFLWTGFFILEGFDFGVGMLHGVVGRTDDERRDAMETIGPLWDGNEVWLIVAGAAMFAAFPGWYATMFSGFYPALVLLLVALILRGTSFEFRGRREGTAWRRTWDWLLSVASFLAPFLLGVALGSLLHGVPIDSSQEFTGDVLDLLSPYALWVGVTFVAVAVVHGAIFLSLKTWGGLRDRARRTARWVAPVAALIVLGFAVWTQISLDRGVVPDLIPSLAVVALVAVVWLERDEREGWAFLMTTLAMAGVVLTIFIDLYPSVMVSSTDPANSLTVHSTASSPYALKVITVVALVFLPLVIAYQAWTYHVFRLRTGIPALRRRPPPPPAQHADGTPVPASD
jgi:cytochrome d ubiquinol oxidase subunit II